LYTRRGDTGDTGLYGSRRVRKDSPRVEAYGNVDELNSCVGLAASICNHEEISQDLKWIQGRLLVVGADLASETVNAEAESRVPRINMEDTQKLENIIDGLQTRLPRLTNFILPGGSVLSAHLHLARSICRRAERSVVTLAKVESINQQLIPFLNRLSTYLFNAARLANVLEGKEDEVWRGS